MAIDGPEITLEQLFHVYLKERLSVLSLQKSEIRFKLRLIEEQTNEANSEYRRLEKEEATVINVLSKLERTYRV